MLSENEIELVALALVKAAAKSDIVTMGLITTTADKMTLIRVTIYLAGIAEAQNKRLSKELGLDPEAIINKMIEEAKIDHGRSTTANDN